MSKGMQEPLLEDLRKGVSEFEASLETSRQGRRDHVGASHDLEAIGSATVGPRVRDPHCSGGRFNAGAPAGIAGGDRESAPRIERRSG